jgi:hypothetical protein
MPAVYPAPSLFHSETSQVQYDGVTLVSVALAQGHLVQKCNARLRGDAQGKIFLVDVFFDWGERTERLGRERDRLAVAVGR